MNNERMFLPSNKRLSHVDVQKIFIKRFYRPHKMSLLNKHSSLHVRVSYAKPETIKDYDSVFVDLSKIINENDAADLFINVMKSSIEYPNFLLLNCEIIDIPVIINLHLPAIYLPDEQK